MKIKKEETYDGGDDGYIKKYDTQGRLVFEECYYSGFNSKKTIIYSANNKIEREEGVRYDQHYGDTRYIKKYEYYEKGYRILTYETAKRSIYDRDPFSDKYGWHNVNNIIEIKEFEYLNKKLQLVTRHIKDKDGNFLTEHKDIFTEKITKNVLNTIIEVVNQDGIVVEKITKDKNDRIIRKEEKMNGLFLPTVINEWFIRNNYIIKKSETISYQSLVDEDDFVDENSFMEIKNTEIKLFKYGVLRSSKTCDYGSWVTKSFYDDKENIINSFSYDGKRNNIQNETEYEYSAKGFLELKMHYGIYKGRKERKCTTKIYYH